MVVNTEELRRNIAKLLNECRSTSDEEPQFLPGTTKIPASGKLIGAEEKLLMIEAALDGWLTAGRFNDQFESSLAKFLGVKYVRTVNSGSSANLIAFSTLTSPELGRRQIVPGDEVITVAAGFPTTVNPIIQNGAIPVFVDIDNQTYNIDVDLIESAITPKTRAIMIAHTLGNPFDAVAIKEICDRYDLWLIEDCCDALGAKINKQMVGTFGDIATLSFYPAHHITMGEGGAVITNNGRLRKIAESFRDWGRDCYCKPGIDNTCKKRFCMAARIKDCRLPESYDHKYIYSHLGYNLKITDMQAACGLGQLEKLEEFIEKRKTNFSLLHSGLSDLGDFLQLPEPTPHSDPSWFGFAVTLKPSQKISRSELISRLEACQIGTRLLFAGNLLKQPYMSSQKYVVSGALTNTEVAMNRTFWIGLHPALTRDMLAYVVYQFHAILNG